MTPFEYVVVLISIILGMGITQLISGIAAIVLRWENIKIYWPHTVIILLIFVLHIQDWWATYELASFQQWRLPTFLFIILYPVILYVLARILFPVRWKGNPIDLREFYFANFRKIYVFMILVPLHSMFDNIYVGGYGWEDQVLQMVLIAILVAVVILNRQEDWVHKLLGILFLFICVITFAVEWNRLLISNAK
jgi:hypothetical protein